MIFDTYILRDYWFVLALGFRTTVFIVLLVFVLGICLGFVVAATTMARSRAMAVAGRIYVNGFRNIPEMVLIFWLYFCLPQIVTIDISAMATGIIALSLVAGANIGEIFRAGVEAVPRGQIEAARSLGLKAVPLWGRIVLPQAARLVIAPMVNYLTDILKHSTLLSAIGVAEIAHSAFQVGGQTFRYLELFTAIGVVFFLCIFPLSVFSRFVRSRLGSL